MSHIDSPYRPLPDARRIAVIGSGAAALGAAWTLSRRHVVTVFDSEPRPGGHANTVEVPGADGQPVAVDTGFIVYNIRTYPNLIRLFDHLKVPTQDTGMSFAVTLDEAGQRGVLEYSGSDLSGLFGQRSNLLRPRFYGMLRDILRFYRQAPVDAQTVGSGLSLGDYLRQNGYGRAFIDDHLLPMAAAIWSAPPETMMAFPMSSFVRFCTNHGLLQITDRPRWRTVVGGSREYVRRLLADTPATLRLGEAVTRVIRCAGGAGVRVLTESGSDDLFDAVVIGTHADQALAMIEAPHAQEQRLLGAFRYQDNLAVLHGDTAQMPVRPRVWSAWNYRARRGPGGTSDLCVTYWMNRLQNLPDHTPLFVTLNPHDTIDPAKEYRRFTYAHPVFDADAMAAQKALHQVQGTDRLWFCGSYFGYGFHEDAFSSGLAAARSIGCPPVWETAGTATHSPAA